MFAHVGCYLAAVTLATLLYARQHPLPLWPAVVGLLLVAGIHVGLDRRGFATWWMRSIGISQDQPWLAIVIDQVFHVLALVVVAQVLSVGSAGSL